MEDSRDAERRHRRIEGDRVKAVREATGLKQPEFAARLNDEARRQGRTWLRYDFSLVSKLENGSRDLSIDDVAVIAAVDPNIRGKLWLAWSEERDSSLRSLRVAEPRPPVANGFQTKEQRAAKKRRPGDKSA